MTDAKASGEQAKTAPSKPKSPARPRAKKAAGAAGTASPPAAPQASPPSSAGARPRSASSRSTNSRKSSRRAATGPGLGDWLSLGLIAVLVAAAAALYQWRGEAQLGSPPPTHSQPAPGTR